MSQSDGWVWALTARDGTGTLVRLWQARTRAKYRRVAPLVVGRLRKLPALYHDFNLRHLPVHEAELLPWGPLKGDFSTPSAKSNPAATIARSATAAGRMARISADYWHGWMGPVLLLIGLALLIAGLLLRR